MKIANEKEIESFFAGKSELSLALFYHFLNVFEAFGSIDLVATKTMIAIDNGHKRITWITQIGKNFIHVVFPFKEPFYDNFCFRKVAQVPGSHQFNHHFRMLHNDDVNDEVKRFMKKAFELE